MPTSVAASTADTSLSADVATRDALAFARSTADTSLSSAVVTRGAQFTRSTADTSATSDFAAHAILSPTGIPPRDVGQPTLFVHVALLVLPVGIAPDSAFGTATLAVTASTIISPVGIPPV